MHDHRISLDLCLGDSRLPVAPIEGGSSHVTTVGSAVEGVCEKLQKQLLKLAQKMPKLRVLFISGYTQDAIVHGGVLEPGLYFLQKPFLPSDLLQAVQNVLQDVPDSRRRRWDDL